MKTRKFKSISSIFTFVTLLFFAQNVQSQDEITRFLNPNLEDANKLMKAWATPFLSASGVNLNNSWYVSADPLKLGRFEIRLIGMTTFAPEKDKNFNVNELGLSTLKHQTGTPAETPTIFGDKNGEVAGVNIYANNPLTNQLDSIGSFMSPNGTGLSFLPGFTPQINLGLMKGTELMVRYIPKLKIGDFERSGFGIGIKHEILQWIPVAKELPISVSVIGTYSKSNLTMKSNILAPSVGVPNPSPADYTTQSIEFNNSGWSAGAAVSKKFPILTLFGGLQYSSSKSSIGLYGPYPIIFPNSTTGSPETQNVIDPIDLESKHNQFGINGGIRIKMGIMHLTISGCYAPGGYSSATVAWGIGWFN